MPILKGRKVIESDDTYYLEFLMSKEESQAILVDAIIEHCANNTLIIKHEHPENENIKKVEILRKIIEDHPDLDVTIKNSYFEQIGNLLK